MLQQPDLLPHNVYRSYVDFCVQNLRAKAVPERLFWSQRKLGTEDLLDGEHFIEKNTGPSAYPITTKAMDRAYGKARLCRMAAPLHTQRQQYDAMCSRRGFTPLDEQQPLFAGWHSRVFQCARIGFGGKEAALDPGSSTSRRAIEFRVDCGTDRQSPAGRASAT